MKIIRGDALEVLKHIPSESIDCCITSPPYWNLRDYKHPKQIGREADPAQYIERLVTLFCEVNRVLKRTGTLWIVIGDTYKRKNLIGLPWMLARELQKTGWILRADCIWHKPNLMPESVKDRPSRSHEYIFFFVKSRRYYYNADSIREPCISIDKNHPSYRTNSVKISAQGRKEFSAKYRTSFRSYPKKGKNKRSVWTVTTKPFKGLHFATFPKDLIEPMIKAGCPKRGLVLDPFLGSGTTAIVAQSLGRDAVGIELNRSYIRLAKRRIKNTK